jgi:hypothetical protein
MQWNTYSPPLRSQLPLSTNPRCSASARFFLWLLDQPDRGVVAVEHLPAVGEFRPRLLQFPPEAVQQVFAGGAAALAQLQVGSRVVGNSLALR